MWGNNIVWGDSLIGLSLDDDNIVWGNRFDDDNIVWGNLNDDNIVWGNLFDDNIVWGNSDDDNIVWGNSLVANVNVERNRREALMATHTSRRTDGHDDALHDTEPGNVAQRESTSSDWREGSPCFRLTASRCANCA